MKRILVLMLALAGSGLAMAQNGRYSSRPSRDVILGQNGGSFHHERGRTASERERAFKVNRVREHYRMRIREVQRSRFMRPSEKRRQIRILERRRDQEIRSIHESYRRYGRFDQGRRRF